MKRHIPNTITSCNLISGCIATGMAFIGSLEWALLWIVIGAVFDFFDGMSARLLKVSSPIGKELDSLADVVTFGVAPSTMLFYQLLTMDYPSFLLPVSEYIPFVAYVMAAFSALRLAKFNLDERQSLGFIGMPTPANALFWGSLTTSYPLLFSCSNVMPLVVIALMFVSCWLLVCEIPMFALKFKHWGFAENKLKYSFVIVCVPLLLFLKLQGIAMVIALYVAISVVNWVIGKNQ